MKKFQKIAICVCAILVSLLSACTKTKTPGINKPNVENTASEASQANILSNIKEANTIDTLYNNLQSGKAGFRTLLSQKISDPDGTFESTMSVLLYKDTDVHMFWNVTSKGEDTMIAVGNGKQIFYENDKHTTLLTGDTYKDFMQIFMLGAYDDCIWTEKVTDIKEANNRITVNTEATDHCCLESLCQEFGYTIDDVDKKTTYYEVDSKTYELYKTKYILHFKDGTSAEVYSSERIEDYKKYSPSNDPTLNIKKLNSYTLTLIENPRTSEELKYQYSIPVEWSWDVSYTDEYDIAVYADPEFKHKLKQENLTKDITGYIRKKDKN